MLESVTAAFLDDVSLLCVLLGFHQRHERHNGCLELLSAERTSAVLGRAASRALRRSLDSADEETDVDIEGWGLTLYSTLGWMLPIRTVSEVIWGHVDDATGATATGGVALTGALLLCWQLLSTDGGAPFASLCAARPPPAPLRAQLLRLVLSATSRLGCDMGKGKGGEGNGVADQLRLGLSCIDALLEVWERKQKTRKRRESSPHDQRTHPPQHTPRYTLINTPNEYPQ